MINDELHQKIDEIIEKIRRVKNNRPIFVL